VFMRPEELAAPTVGQRLTAERAPKPLEMSALFPKNALYDITSRCGGTGAGLE
jgi:hypothetical protein